MTENMPTMSPRSYSRFLSFCQVGHTCPFIGDKSLMAHLQTKTKKPSVPENKVPNILNKYIKFIHLTQFLFRVENNIDDETKKHCAVLMTKYVRY